MEEFEGGENTVGIQESNMEIQSNKSTRRHLWDESNSLKAKVAKQTANIIKMKVHSDAVNWELNNKIQISEESYKKLELNLQKLQVENEKLIETNQTLVSTKANIHHKFERFQKLNNHINERYKKTLEALKGIEDDKENITAAFDHHKKGIEEVKSDMNVLKEEHSKQLLAVQQKLDEKCDRIVELTKALSITENMLEDAKSAIDTLKATNNSSNNLVQESTNKLPVLEEQFNKLQEESSQKNEQLALALAEAEKQCSIKEVESNSVKNELDQKTSHASELTQNLNGLKDEVAALEKKIKEQELTYENKVADAFIEQNRLLKVNEDLQQEMENEKEKHIQEVETNTKQIAELEARSNNLLTGFDTMKEETKSIEEQLNGKLGELETIKSLLQEAENDKQKLQDDMQIQNEKNKVEIEKLQDLVLEVDRESEAMEMELNKKIKLLENHDLIESEKYNELKKECTQNDISKKYDELEQKYNHMVAVYENTQKLENTCTRKNKEASPSVEVSVDKLLPATENTKDQADDCRVPNVPVWRNASPKTNKNAFYSDSENSDWFAFDPRIIQKKFAHFSKEEQKGIVNKNVSKVQM